MRTMYDAANASLIPPQTGTADLIAGYVNGLYKWSAADWNRFPAREHIGIQIYVPGQSHIDRLGEVYDVEASDAPSPLAQQEAALWAFSKQQQGVRPTLYTSKSTQQYLSHIDCDWWIADPDDPVPHILPGCVATQYGYFGGYDVSAVVDVWPRKVTPVAGKLFSFTPTKSGQGYWIVTDQGLYAYGDATPMSHPLPTPAPLKAFVVTPSEKGCWFVDDDANVYAYGDAPFLGHP